MGALMASPAAGPDGFVRIRLPFLLRVSPWWGHDRKYGVVSSVLARTGDMPWVGIQCH